MNARDLPGPGDFGGLPSDPRAPNYRGDPPEIEPAKPLTEEWIARFMYDLSDLSEDIWIARDSGDIAKVHETVRKAIQISTAAMRNIQC